MRLTDYLKYQKNVILAYIFFAGILLVCFFLYKIPLYVLWYPYSLCLLAGMAFLGAGYIRCRRKCLDLDRIAGLSADLIEDLPEPLSPEARQYQRILESLCAGNIQSQALFRRKYEDMLDYYTAWAHQIKTPIAAMKLSFQNEDSPLARQSLNDLRRIEQYVDMVLTYLKLDSGDIDYVIREHDLDDIIRPVIRSFAGEFINRKIRIDYQPIDYRVLTDDKWFAFVLEQVISNALKYTREGSVRIFMEGTALCIRDTGIGIEKEDIPRIFEKGFTGCNGRRDRRATGIGLYLCKRICDNLAHEIHAESSVGEGTTIRIGLDQTVIGIE